jgi:hypothetical protein
MNELVARGGRMNHTYLAFSLIAAVTFMGPDGHEPRDRREVEAKVVATRTLHQTGVLPETTIFTPTTDGNFRISLYLSVPSQSQNVVGQFLGVAGRWTDDSGTFRTDQITGGAVLVAQGGFVGPVAPPQASSGTVFVHVKANTPIQVFGEDTGDSRTDRTDPYTLYVVLEQMPSELQEDEQ